MSLSNAAGPVLWDVDARGVATVTLNRPEVNNAYNGELIQGLLAALDALGGRAGPARRRHQGQRQAFPGRRRPEMDRRGAHLIGGGECPRLAGDRGGGGAAQPCAGADRGAGSRRGCFGGGTGLVAACDVVIAADNATFSIAEVRWGLTAAIIVPQLNDAIGVRQLRRYGLTGERFNAEEARRIGLVHEVVPLAELAAAGERVVGHVLENAPEAIAQTKALTLKAAFGDLDDAAFAALIESHAAKRQSPEAAEGPRLVRRKTRGEVDAEKTSFRPISVKVFGWFDGYQSSRWDVFGQLGSFSAPRHENRCRRKIPPRIVQLEVSRRTKRPKCLD